MEQMIDWEYYNSHFPTPIPERVFAAVEAQAEIELRKVVPDYKIKTISEETLKDCVFQICNFLYNNSAVLSGIAVTSVNNNGYAESYAIQTPDQAHTVLEDLIFNCVGRLAGAF